MTVSCADCQVRDISLCGSLTDRELETLSSFGRRKIAARGDTLVWAGDASEIVANILSGVLKLSMSTSDGREQIVGLLFPADFIGHPYAEQTDFTITALTDAELCVFSRHQFRNMMEGHSRMERALLQRTLAALDEARGRMLMLGRRSAGEKIAAFLLEMATRSQDGCTKAPLREPLTFDLPLSRGQIADVLGLTIETVSRQITKLKTGGVIALPSIRSVTILNAQALKDMAESG